jgi:HNH endonuclease/AP2 domain
MKNSITQEELRRLLHYDPETGWFTWRVARNSYAGRAKPGARAGTIGQNQYKAPWRQITLRRVRYKEHRLAWLYVTGEWPPQEIDHINRDATDNRLANLRLASRAQNQANTHRAKKTLSGLKGAYRGKAGRWFSHISVNRRLIKLGRFDTAEEAHAAYCEAAKLYYGEFARFSKIA